MKPAKRKGFTWVTSFIHWMQNNCFILRAARGISDSGLNVELFYPWRYLRRILNFIFSYFDFGSLLYSGRNRNLYFYLFFTFSFLSFVQQNLVSPAPSFICSEMKRKKQEEQKSISYSDTIFKTDYYLYSIDSCIPFCSFPTSNRMFPSLFFLLDSFDIPYRRWTQIPFWVKEILFSAFQFLCWFSQLSNTFHIQSPNYSTCRLDI